MALVLRRQVGLVAELRFLRGQAEQAAVLEERQRLSRELHDSVTQSLYGISLYAEAAARALGDGHVEPALGSLREIRDTTQEALGEMRLLLFELRPLLLQERGLAAALRARLQAVETRAGVVYEFDCQGEERLAPEKGAGAISAGTGGAQQRAEARARRADQPAAGYREWPRDSASRLRRCRVRAIHAHRKLWFARHAQAGGTAWRDAPH